MAHPNQQALEPELSLFDQDTPSSCPSDRPRQDPEQVVRADGQFACVICGGPACFGFDVKLTQNRLGVWACPEHRETVKCRR